jgi:hypothetical protein
MRHYDKGRKSKKMHGVKSYEKNEAGYSSKSEKIAFPNG